MKLKNLLICLRSDIINIGIVDTFKFVCVAPKDSPVLDAYLNREICFIDICKKSDKDDDAFAADLVVTLEVESED